MQSCKDFRHACKFLCHARFYVRTLVVMLSLSQQLPVGRPSFFSLPSDDLVDQVVFISCERGECSNAEGRDWTEDTAVTAAEYCGDSG